MPTIRAAPVVLLVLAFGPPAMAQDALGKKMPELQVTIVPAKDEQGQLTISYDKYFEVHLTNRSDRPIKLWSESCQPGFTALRFRITDKNGNSWTMQRRPDDTYWADYPVKTITIAAGANHVWRVTPTEFFQGERAWTGVPDPNSGEDLAITPIFDIKADAQTNVKDVWSGRIEGPAVKVRVVDPSVKTPHDYLWNGFPKQALKIMRADPTWVNKKDPEYRCTPLHHASRFGFVEVVEWLLANGAEVDARAYNNFSPLYFAREPEVVRSILRHKPKDKERAAEFFRYPLICAAERIAEARWDTKKDKEIVKLMLGAGAPYTIQAAVYLNDVDRIQALLKEDPRLVHSADDDTPLRIAARFGRTEICKILLKHKADPNDWENGNGYPIVISALEHPKVVKQLLDAGADIKKRISMQHGGKTGYWFVDDEATALHYAAQDGYLESARILLDAGIDVSAKDTRGHTALDIAVLLKQGETAHLIATRMGTAAARELGQRALLRQLIFSGKPDQLKKFLKEKGVAEVLAREGPAFMRSAASEIRDTESKRESKENARFAAIIETLHGLGIPIDIYSAISIDNASRAKELLKADPKLANSKGPDGESILHRAITLDRREIAGKLLKAGADPDSPNDDGYTALHSAALWRRSEIASLLIERRANANACTKSGYTPLHEAVRLGSVEVARILVGAGANVNAADKHGHTPLGMAQASEYTEMIDVLSKR